MRFETWYEQHQKRMQNDRVFRYFKEARNNLEKQGRIETAVSATIIVTPEDWRAIDLTKPPGAEDFFLADHLGGSGWDIPLPNGEKLKYYVNLPESVAKIDIFFSGDLANKFLSENHQSTIELAKYILDELGKIVDDARTFFILQEPSQTYSGKRLPPFLKVIK